MSRLIDADTLKANINTAFWSGIEKIIDSAPTVDAVDVVRCKDCVHRTDESWCRLMGEYMQDQGYCSRGGRKDEWL